MEVNDHIQFSIGDGEYEKTINNVQNVTTSIGGNLLTDIFESDITGKLSPVVKDSISASITNFSNPSSKIEEIPRSDEGDYNIYYKVPAASAYLIKIVGGMYRYSDTNSMNCCGTAFVPDPFAPDNLPISGTFITHINYILLEDSTPIIAIGYLKIEKGNNNDRKFTFGNTAWGVSTDKSYTFNKENKQLKFNPYITLIN